MRVRDVPLAFDLASIVGRVPRLREESRYPVSAEEMLRERRDRPRQTFRRRSMFPARRTNRLANRDMFAIAKTPTCRPLSAGGASNNPRATAYDRQQTLERSGSCSLFR